MVTVTLQNLYAFPSTTLLGKVFTFGQTFTWTEG